MSIVVLTEAELVHRRKLASIGVKARRLSANTTRHSQMLIELAAIADDILEHLRETMQEHLKSQGDPHE